MPISGQRRRFNSWQISGAPPEKGVYALFDGEELVYVGRAYGGDMTIRSRLFEHYAKRAAPHDATHYACEVSAQPAQREAELLLEFERANARLPRWNA